jgi:hypothetical protein
MDLRERVAVAIYCETNHGPDLWTSEPLSLQEVYYRRADAALLVIAATGLDELAALRATWTGRAPVQQPPDPRSDPLG